MLVKLLGVYISDTLDVGKLIEYVLQICTQAQRLYLLNQLKRGLCKPKNL